MNSSRMVLRHLSFLLSFILVVVWMVFESKKLMVDSL